MFISRRTGEEVTDDNFRQLEAESRAPDVQTVRFAKLFVAPPRPQDGEVYYADGTSWNPGAGAGLYRYDGAAWNFLG